MIHGLDRVVDEIHGAAVLEFGFVGERDLDRVGGDARTFAAAVARHLLVLQVRAFVATGDECGGDADDADVRGGLQVQVIEVEDVPQGPEPPRQPQRDDRVVFSDEDAHPAWGRR